jgi:acetyltransferase-like isoleucine patch superfamily enzyme
VPAPVVSSTSRTTRLRQWVKARDNWFTDTLYRAVKSLSTVSMPTIPLVHRLLYLLYRSAGVIWSNMTRMVWYTPLFQSRLDRPAARLYVYGGMPLIMGPVRLSFGSKVRISGQTTISGRTAGSITPRLTLGNNVDIGWQTTIAVGSTISIGNNVRIAGRAFLAGYPGHPLDAAARAAGAADTYDQVGDIVLEDDVWLATGVTVSAGVRIGRGTIIAAGSVVTSDLPPGVLAAGAPARVIRPLVPPMLVESLAA